jgi:hypothetical protein
LLQDQFKDIPLLLPTQDGLHQGGVTGNHLATGAFLGGGSYVDASRMFRLIAGTDSRAVVPNRTLFWLGQSENCIGEQQQVEKSLLEHLSRDCEIERRLLSRPTVTKLVDDGKTLDHVFAFQAYLQTDERYMHKILFALPEHGQHIRGV